MAGDKGRGVIEEDGDHLAFCDSLMLGALKKVVDKRPRLLGNVAERRVGAAPYSGAIAETDGLEADTIGCQEVHGSHLLSSALLENSQPIILQSPWPFHMEEAYGSSAKIDRGRRDGAPCLILMAVNEAG